MAQKGYFNSTTIRSQIKTLHTAYTKEHKQINDLPDALKRFIDKAEEMVKFVDKRHDTEPITDEMLKQAIKYQEIIDDLISLGSKQKNPNGPVDKYIKTEMREFLSNANGISEYFKSVSSMASLSDVGFTLSSTSNTQSLIASNQDGNSKRLENSNSSAARAPTMMSNSKTSAHTQGHCFQCQKQIDDLNQQIQTLHAQLKTSRQGNSNPATKGTTLTDELKRKDAQITQLKMEVDSLTRRLSEAWNERVDADETNLENVNIKNRPMNVAADYEAFISQAWLDGKNFLDQVCSKDSTERDKISFLGDILIKAEGVAKYKFCRLTLEIFGKINEAAEVPAAASGKSTNQNAILSSMVSTSSQKSKLDLQTLEDGCANIPSNLRNAISDFLRRTADTANIEGLFQSINKEIQNQTLTDRKGKIMQQLMKHEDGLSGYIAACGRLAWKMVIQRPPMTFDKKTGLLEKWLGDKVQNVWYGSEDPSNKGCVVQYYVHPALLHDKVIMVKGNVIVAKKSQ